jgi:hypothetical protein
MKTATLSRFPQKGNSEIGRYSREREKKGVLLFASASNEGANHPITFPPRLRNIVFCIEAADGKGNSSAFNPPFLVEEKYIALGEAVMGAQSTWLASSSMPKERETYIRKDGTSIRYSYRRWHCCNVDRSLERRYWRG